MNKMFFFPAMLLVTAGCVSRVQPVRETDNLSGYSDTESVENYGGVTVFPDYDNSFLMRMVDMINRESPRMIDDECRLDGAQLPRWNMLQYNYTLINYSRNEVSEREIINLQHTVLSAVNDFLDSEDGQPFREVILCHVYKDKNGYFLFDAVFYPDNRDIFPTAAGLSY